MEEQLRDFLNRKVKQYNQPSFVKDDPVCIPHLFSKKQDIEIAGLFAAVFAWGNRTIIIKKSKDLLNRMDNAPYDFITNHEERHLKKLLEFRHRTFNDTDLLYFIQFLHHHYSAKPIIGKRFYKGDATAGSQYRKWIKWFLQLLFLIGRCSPKNA